MTAFGFITEIVPLILFERPSNEDNCVSVTKVSTSLMAENRRDTSRSTTPPPDQRAPQYLIVGGVDAGADAKVLLRRLLIRTCRLQLVSDAIQWQPICEFILVQSKFILNHQLVKPCTFSYSICVPDFTFDNKHFAHHCVPDFSVGWGNSMEGSNELLFNQAWSDKCICGEAESFFKHSSLQSMFFLTTFQSYELYAVKLPTC